MEVVKAHVLAYVDAAHAVLTEHKAVGTLADEAAVCVDARSTLADPATILALVHICQHTLYRIKIKFPRHLTYEEINNC